MASWLDPDTNKVFNYGNNGLNFSSGNVSNIISGLFGNGGQAFQDAGNQFDKYYNTAQGYQQPFYQAGTQAIPQYQNYVNSMQNPSGFINNLMGQYQESPYARFAQQQAQRANTNAASASGLIGSTPYQQQGEQYAHDISTQDMNQWLQNVLGINTQYGGGLQNLMTGGQNAANMMTQLAGTQGQNMAGTAYGQSQGQSMDFSNLLGGLAGLFF